MSRRKDRERFLAMKRGNPDYVGFRNSQQELDQGMEDISYQAVTCSSCGKKRNVSPEIAKEQSDNYVCMSCLEENDSEDAQAVEVNA